MKTSKFGEIVLDEHDLYDLLMQGKDLTTFKNLTIDSAVDIEKLITFLEDPGQLITWTVPHNSDVSLCDYDALKQNTWFMPNEYKNMDIAEYILGQCRSQLELQRCGEELLMFQERNMFDLLCYLKYLVDTMIEHQVIWGVGRGSSVASYVLFKLGVHKIDSLFYDLDPTEFLR
jgi:DNA polymerase III alpha subunit